MRSRIFMGGMVAVTAVLFSLAVLGSVSSDSGGSPDFDGDGCEDVEELGDDPTLGGRRDPTNQWDYFNPTHDGRNRVDDILMVVHQYFIDQGNPDYTEDTDRTRIPDGDPWDFGPPNGQQRVDDILAAVVSYFHDCADKAILLPEALKFVTGVSSPEELQELIDTDLAPFLEAIASAGEGGSSGFVEGQEVGEYRIACVYPDGGFMIVPKLQPTPIAVPTDPGSGGSKGEEAGDVPDCL
jgi:hypothetical protein